MYSLPNVCPGETPFTDYSRWRLLVNDGGRQTWHYLETDEECKAWPQNTVDKFWLGIDTGLPDLPLAKDAYEAARKGYEFYKHLQCHDGHWAGEFGGPMFLLPGLVIGSYISGMGFKEAERLEMIRYLFNRAHKEDGGWGLHVEGDSTCFGTALNYVSLRILGVGADHPVCVKARACLHNLGGAVGIPSWGKFWLSLLGVYDWEGNNPVPPELWLLPDWLPIHPHRWWIHTRAVYLPMSYLYGIKFKFQENDLILALRQELYTQDYYSIYWPDQRNNVCKVDLYSPHSKLFDMMSFALGVYEQCALPSLRTASVNYAYKLICYEDENTSYQTLAPISKMFNLVARACTEGPNSEAYRMHEIKRRDFMWLGADGMKMCGTNGCQLWDIGFIVQGVVETGLADLEENKESMIQALHWLDQAQIQDNPIHYHSQYRHASKGAWPFSTREQGYTVSDTTGEGLKAALYLQHRLNYTPNLISARRMFDAIDVLLSLQNPSGGYASYEPVRGSKWLELLNPAEVFRDIMTEYLYPECTTSVITALANFRKVYPDYRASEIEVAIRKGVVFLHKVQKPEGGWLGSWGICFTYATQFALESLSLVGETYVTSDYARRACQFLISKQRPDGGWGESYKSCEQKVWVEHENTQVVQTCWAVMALMHAEYPYPEPIERGVRLVMSRQLPNGSWPQEAIEGIFSKTCAIAYPNFKFSFSIWMLGKAHHYLNKLKGKNYQSEKGVNGDGHR